jgi:hypothetical protein
MKQHHILEGLNPQQKISNLTITTCLEKAIPLQCTFLQGIINFFLQLNKFQINHREEQISTWYDVPFTFDYKEISVKRTPSS